MESLKIHRPYGRAGRLPWEKGDQPSLDFGSGNYEQIAQSSRQIRTFTERVDEGDELNNIKRCISEAERIVFLGFAFHRQNVEIISSKARSNVEILATTFDISDSDQRVINREVIKSLFLSEDGKINHRYMEMAPITCKDLFKNYWRTLTSEAAEEPYDAMESIRSARPIMPNFPSFK
jgi:hypothetical protein